MSDHTPTFADICNAIAEGHIPAALDGPVYQVNALELRRYLNSFRALPVISRLTQKASAHCDANEWSTCAQTSLM